MLQNMIFASATYYWYSIPCKQALYGRLYNFYNRIYVTATTD